MRYLFLGEKPSVTKYVEEVYKSNIGEFQRKGMEIDFAPMHGHLLRMMYPEELNPEWASWDEKHLPIIPKTYKYTATDTRSVSAIMSKIKSGNYDALINGCDSGREGENIFWTLYYAENLKLPVYRYWISSNAEAAALKGLLGITNYDDKEKFRNLRESAILRARFDWLVGMNFTRAASASSETTVNIGRVMTPVMKIVCDRENEIKNFVSQDFFELEALFDKNGEGFKGTAFIDEKQTRFDKKEDVESLRSKVGKTAKVVDVTVSQKSQKAPALFSTSELQKVAFRTFKFSASKTLEIAQKLYEGGYITYPRTDARYLSTDIVPELLNHMGGMASVPVIGTIAGKITQKVIDDMVALGKTYIDDSKIEDHHAIIPDVTLFPWDKATEEERKIYSLVAKQFLAIFYPPYETDNTEAILESNGVNFKANGTVITNKGYKALYVTTGIPYPQKEKNAPDTLPQLVKGDEVLIKELSVSEGKTEPPKRYDPDTLLSAMQNAGQFVDDAKMKSNLRAAKGIGTEATRASIIEKLLSNGFFSEEKYQYIPSEFSMELTRLYGDKNFTSPILTAEWEGRLREIESGKTSQLEVEREMQEYVKDGVQEILSVRKNLKALRGKMTDCPICGAPVKKGKNCYYCTNYKPGEETSCTFIIPFSFMGASISDREFLELAAGNPLKEKTFTKKDGSKFTAKLIYSTTGEKQGFQWYKEERSAVCKCPSCGGDIFKGKKAYYCGNYKADDPCKVFIPFEVMGAKLSEKDAVSLLSGEVIGPKKLTKKDGTKFESKLVYNKDEAKFSLYREQKEPKEEAGICPVCGSKIIKGQYGYYCEGRYSDAKCQLSIPNAEFTDTELAKLLNGEIVGPKTVKKKDGGTFDTKLVFDKEKGTVVIHRDVSPTSNIVMGTCPLCGGNVLETEKGYNCQNKQSGNCNFGISKVIKGATITGGDIKLMLDGKESTPHIIDTVKGPAKAVVYFDSNGIPKFRFLN